MKRSNDVNNLYLCGREAIVNQFLYCQNCRGKELQTRALHYILSYDTAGWEWEMDRQTTVRSTVAIWSTAKQFDLYDYQCLMGVHDNGKNRHIHIIVNPVNQRTKKILHYGMYQYKRFIRVLAAELHMRFGLALESVSYIREDGRRIFSDETIKLYEDRMYPWQPHMSQTMGKREDLLNPFVYAKIKK